MEAWIIAVLGVTGKWATDFVKDITNKNLNGILTRMVAVAIAWGLIALSSHQSIPVLVNTLDLTKLSGFDLFLLSFPVAATAGTGNDILRTFNHADTNVQAKLISPEIKNAA